MWVLELGLMDKKCKCGHSIYNHLINGCMYMGTPEKKEVCYCTEFKQ